MCKRETRSLTFLQLLSHLGIYDMSAKEIWLRNHTAAARAGVLDLSCAYMTFVWELELS